MNHFFALPLSDQATLTTLLSQSHRHYHNINHINDCLSELYICAQNSTLADIEIEILTYAIWLHDIVYNPYAPSGVNERQSSEMVDCVVRNYATYKSQAIKEAIKATAHHTAMQSNFAYATTQVMLDIDLAGLGNPLHIYATNSVNIRQEYYNTTDKDFITGRLEFLRTINRRDCFYYTDYFADLYHKTSKENVALEIEMLEQAIAKDDPNNYFERLYESWHQRYI